ncbi:hypothetical protein L4C34_05905 [Vibrio profundum]|uniref:hypothetical protein n=1 Tax=Vibrio profundum TaxID=2910247 RepID=UPI003D0A1D2C
MQIEIYMPCEPQWFCEILLVCFSIAAIVGIAMLIRIVYLEHKKLNYKNKGRNKRGD